MNSLSRQSSFRNRGLTLIELLVCIGIILILVGIVLPVYSQAKESAVNSQKVPALRQLYAAMSMYVADFDNIVPFGLGPTDQTWEDRLLPYVGDQRIMINPSIGRLLTDLDLSLPIPVGRGYALNEYLERNSFDVPNRVVLFTEATATQTHDLRGHWPNVMLSCTDVQTAEIHRLQGKIYRPVGGRYLGNHFRGGSTFAFTDGSVMWIPVSNDYRPCLDVPNNIFLPRYHQR